MHLSRRLKCTIVITRCPSSVVRRPSLTFHIFDFFSETAEQNSTKLDRKQDLNVLYQVCVFRADRKNKMAALASDWLRHFRLLLWNRWTELNKTWQEARSQRPLPSFCFSGRSEKQDGRPALWLAETFSTSPLKPLNGIERNLTGSKTSTSSTKFVFFGPIEKQDGRPGLWLAQTNSTSSLKPLKGIEGNLILSKISMSSTNFMFFGQIGKTRWPLWPLIGWDIFDFSSETAERNWTKLDRKQDLNVLYQVCVFRADWKNKMAALPSDWLRHFRLLLWNRWTELNKTWQEARSQRPLPRFCFSGRSEKQDGRPALWLAETFSTSPLKPLNGIEQNLTGSKISTSSTTFLFFGSIGKTRWPPWPLIGWDIFDFSSETAERNWTKLDRKQDLNVLYQVCVFRADRKTRWPPWPLIGSDKFDFFSETTERNWRKLDRKQDLNVLYKFYVFRADRKNKMAALPSDWLRHFRLLLWNRWTKLNKTWQEARSQRPLPSLCFSGRSEKQDGRPGLWLAETFSTSSLKLLNGIERNLTGSKISTSSTKFVFFGPIGKTRWPPCPLIGWDIFDFSSETDERNWKNLTGSKIWTSSTKFLFFGPIGKTRWPLWPLIRWDIFDFSSETAERNWTKLDRKQDLNVLYQVGVFRADRKNKMAALPSDWLRHFRLVLWNRWTELNKTWQEARSQRPLPRFLFFGPIGKTRWPPWPLIGWDIFDFSSETAERNWKKLDRKQNLNVLEKSLCFSGRSEKQDGRPALWLAETFSTSPLKPLNGIEQNLTGSKTSTSSTKFVFFGPIEKQDGRPGLWLAQTNSTSSLKPLKGIEGNLIGSKISMSSTNFMFFGQIGKTRWPPWPLIGRDIFRLLLWNRWMEFKETWQEARSQHPLPSLYFSGRLEKQDGRQADE